MYFTAFTVIGWSALAVVSRYSQILLLLLKVKKVFSFFKQPGYLRKKVNT